MRDRTGGEGGGVLVRRIRGLRGRTIGCPVSMMPRVVSAIATSGGDRDGRLAHCSRNARRGRITTGSFGWRRGVSPRPPFVGWWPTPVGGEMGRRGGHEASRGDERVWETEGEPRRIEVFVDKTEARSSSEVASATQRRGLR